MTGERLPPQALLSSYGILRYSNSNALSPLADFRVKSSPLVEVSFPSSRSYAVDIVCVSGSFYSRSVWTFPSPPNYVSERGDTWQPQRWVLLDSHDDLMCARMLYLSSFRCSYLSANVRRLGLVYVANSLCVLSSRLFTRDKDMTSQRRLFFERQPKS